MRVPAAGRLVAATLIGVATLACGGSGSPAGTSAAATTPSASEAPSMPGATAGASPDDGSPASPGVAVDAALLDVLPDTVEGLPVSFSAEGSEAAAGSTRLGETAESLAYAVVEDPATGDVAVVAVTRLRPDVFDDGFFRDWRDSYNDEVCGPVGGVTGNAEGEIGGRPVWIGSCADGPRTYHAWLPGRRTIVSTYAAGEGRLGERVIEALRE